MNIEKEGIFKVFPQDKKICFETKSPFKFFRKEYTKFHTYKSAYEVAHLLLGESKDERFKYTAKPQVKFKLFVEVFGVTASAYLRHHTALMIKMWLDPYKNIIDGIGYDRTRRAIPHIVGRVWSLSTTLDELLGDGLDNLSGIVVALKKTPFQLKYTLGKGLWKTVCRNSKTRNYFLAKAIIANEIDFGGRAVQPKHLVETLNSLPSGVLGVIGKVDLDSFYYSYRNTLASALVKDQKRVLSSNGYYGLEVWGRKYSLALNTYRDTKRLSEQLGEKFDVKWSLKTMQKKHEEYTEKYELKRFSKDPYESLSKMKDVKFVLGEATAELIMSPFDLRQEGIEMRHCVASYSPSVAAGNFIVFSIKCGDSRSTLGIRVRDTGRIGCSPPRFFEVVDNPPYSEVEKISTYKIFSYEFGQHYSYCNGEVTCKDSLAVAEYVIRKLNGEIDEAN